MENLYPWLKNIWQYLSDKKDKFPHASLFVGRRGVGKSKLLCKLAKFILCDNNENQECGICQSCQWFSARTHPDYFELGKNETVKVDEVRILKDWLALTPHCYRRVIVVNELGSFNTFAQNALLKTLEESPFGVHFIMATSNLNLVLPTVYSRCQPFYLQIDFEIVKNWFSEQGIPSKFYWLQETPLAAKNYYEKYGGCFLKFLDELEIFLENPTNFSNLRSMQNQFILDDLINIYYVLMRQFVIYSNSYISFNKDYRIDPEDIFIFENWLINLQKTRKQQINLNEELLRENLILRFVKMFKVSNA